MLKRLAAVLALVGTALTLALCSPAQASGRQAVHAVHASHAVLIGVPGLRWTDVSPSATPNLWRLASGGAAGLLSVRTVGRRTCPEDAWATISAGVRSAAGPYCGRPVTLTPAGAGVSVGETAALRRINAGFGPVGLLGDAVHRSGGCTAAAGPGAALAVADSTGRVDEYAPSPSSLPAAWTRCPVGVVDLGPVGAGGSRPVAVRRADALVGSVLGRLSPGTDVFVAGVADDSVVHLRLAVATGPGLRGRYLGSDSTRRSDMVILPDLTASLLDSAGISPPAGLIGTPPRPTAVRPALASAVTDLSSQDVAAQTHRRLLPLFFTAFVIGQVLLYAAAAVALRLRWSAGRRRKILAATRLTALAAAAVPVATYLVNLMPWWHTGHPAAWLVAGVAIGDLLVVGVAVAGPWRRDILGAGTAVALVTAAVLGLDLVTGSNLQMNSLMGYSPLVGGRYYGMGNIAFAVLATSALLASAGLAQWLAPRRGRPAAVTVVLVLTLTAAVLDSWTAWGSDFGGLIAFVPGLATTALLVAGRRVGFIRLQLLRATGMAIVLGVAYLDYLRPPAQQTHMGRFFGDLVQGNALPWLERKFTAMLHTFGNLTLLPVVVAAFLFVLLVLHRPGRAGASGLQLAYERAPMLRAGLSGAFVTALVGGAVNDSGIAIPALSLAVAVPLALAATVFALRARDESPAPPAAPATAAT